VRVLARTFLEAQRRKLGRPSLDFGPGFEAALAAYDWPGNVRELRNGIERACILADDDTVDVSDLGLPIRAPVSVEPGGTDEGILASLEREAILRELRANGGNRKATARRLGISLRTLQYRLKEFGIV
jgi:DNA-binding NtrC family response regulator